MNNLQKNANNYNNYLKFMEVKMGKRDFYQDEKMKRYIYVFGVTLVISSVVFLTIFVMYNKKMKKEANMKFENLGVIEDIVSNDNLEETSSTSDSGIKDKKEFSKQNTVNNKINKTPVSSTITNTEKNKNTKSENKLANNINNNIRNEISNTVNNIVENVTVEEKKVEKLNFKAPVSGEIIKDFAIDNLIYSNTLEEWTTHSGIDIKAEKTSVVVAAENGTIESIKNDPRFGLTITISHEGGFKTIYSNLLTTEFVTENEVVEKGQTIATVGETASFEVADEPHLHFEIYKNGSPVNPTIYLK